MHIGDGIQYSLHERTIFIIGSVSNQVLKTFDCRQPVYFAEVNWDLLFSLIPGKNQRFTGIPKFQEVRRDLALLVDHEVTFSQIEKLAFQTERKLLKNIGLFDVYEGEKIPAGKKSYALNLILQDEDKTLTDKDIDKAMEKIIRAMAASFNAQLR
jgi:phenylalanyl-tRNA synthetase beta chain